ncbi:hypothetical protein LZ32DRAFT_191045 [Colletotrichum eremochloae]|nr:hypothetical protein LZ32DRAFT_191045 [Colletotrichum eremochloae]
MIFVLFCLFPSSCSLPVPYFSLSLPISRLSHLLNVPSSLASHAVAFRAFHFHFHLILDTSSRPGPFLWPPNQSRLTLSQSRSKVHFAFSCPVTIPPVTLTAQLFTLNSPEKSISPVSSRFHLYTPLPPRIVTQSDGKPQRETERSTLEYSRENNTEKKREKQTGREEERRKQSHHKAQDSCIHSSRPPLLLLLPLPDRSLAAASPSGAPNQPYIPFLFPLQALFSLTHACACACARPLRT